MITTLPGTFRIISVILFFVGLMLFYSFSSPELKLYATQAASKNVLFYGFMATFFIINLLFLAFSRYVRGLRIDQRFRETLAHWLISFCAVINFNLLFLLAFIGISNYDEHVPVGLYVWLIPLGVVLIIIWIFRIMNKVILNVRRQRNF